MPDFDMKDIAEIYNNGNTPRVDIGDHKILGDAWKENAEIFKNRDGYSVLITEDGLQHRIGFRQDGSIDVKIKVKENRFNLFDLQQISGQKNIEIGNEISIKNEKLADWSKKYLPKGKEFTSLEASVSKRIKMMQEFLPSKKNALINKTGDTAYYVGVDGQGLRTPVLEVCIPEKEVESFLRQYPRANRQEYDGVLKSNPKQSVFTLSHTDDIHSYATQKGSGFFKNDLYFAKIKELTENSPTGLLINDDRVNSRICSSKGGVEYDPLKKEVRIDLKKMTQTEFNQLRTRLMKENLPTGKILQYSDQLIIPCKDADGLKQADSALNELAQMKKSSISSEIKQVQEAISLNPDNKVLYREIFERAQSAQAAKKIELAEAPKPKSIPESSLSGKLSETAQVGKEVRALDAVSDTSKVVRAGESASTLVKAGKAIDGVADAEKAESAAVRAAKALGKLM